MNLKKYFMFFRLKAILFIIIWILAWNLINIKFDLQIKYNYKENKWLVAQ